MFNKRFNELQQLIQLCIYTDMVGEVTEEEALHRIDNFFVQNSNGKVYLIGNGGSAGIASHTCIDLVNGCEIPAMTLYDSNVMTCLSNDYGYHEVFSRPLNLYLNSDDIVIAISSSGKSQNILNAIKVAKRKNASIITFTGFSKDNPLRQAGDLNFWLGSTDYGLVEMGHFFLLHTITDSLKAVRTKKSKIAYA